MCLCTRDQTTRTACAPGTTAVVEHMLDPLAGHRRIRQGAASRHAETRRRLIYRGRDTGRRHRVCGQCRGYRVGSGSMVAGRCHKATPQPNTSGAMSTNMSCTWARGPRSSFTACQPAIGRYLGRWGAGHICVSLTRGCGTSSTWRWPTCATLRRRGRSGRINGATSFCHQA